jgi:GAF domain-containing protein
MSLDNPDMSAAEPNHTDTTPGLTQITAKLEELADLLDVKSVLVMRSEPDSMVVAATAGEATKHYTVGAAGRKAGDDTDRVPLYCERVVNTDEALFIRDSRTDATFAGNEDEAEFGLSNYLGVPVHDPAGNVVGTVCVLDDTTRDYSDDQLRALKAIRSDVEQIVSRDGTALG